MMQKLRGSSTTPFFSNEAGEIIDPAHSARLASRDPAGICSGCSGADPGIGKLLRLRIRTGHSLLSVQVAILTTIANAGGRTASGLVPFRVAPARFTVEEGPTMPIASNNNVKEGWFWNLTLTKKGWGARSGRSSLNAVCALPTRRPATAHHL